MQNGAPVRHESFEQHVIRRLGGIEEKQEILLRGQADLTVAFGRIWRRVRVLEQDARWKRWAANAGKAALPFIAGAAAAKWPALAGLISEITKASGAP